MFFRRGVTLAALKVNGTWPEVMDVLIINVMKGIRSDAMVWKIGEGRGSREQVVGLEEFNSFSTFSGERGVKADRQVFLGVYLGVLDSVL